jgi:hypothetical protein
MHDPIPPLDMASEKRWPRGAGFAFAFALSALFWAALGVAFL